ncbi:MAG: DUF885 domain-containing protein [Candidatus Eremiobacteraeota bacterium]|nr:DUF885 domain-containing protein [Candidatus Eremiobacteraeota bacterium]
MQNFAQTSRAIVDDILENDPIEATWAGIHDYDALLPDVSLDGFAQDQLRAKNHLATLRAWNPDALTPGERIDWNLLVSKFEVELRELAELEPHKHDPSFYPGTAISGIYSLLARDYAPLAERLPALESRLQKMPEILAAGKTNLERSPRIWTDIAIEETEGGAEFLQHTVGAIAEKYPALRASLDKAVAASADYADFLRTRHIGRDGMPFAIGRELFDFKLRREHLLDFDADSLLSVGERAVQSTQAQMVDVARQIDPKRSWTELIDSLRRELPAESTLLQEYRAGVDETRQFVIDRKLVSIPGGESLQVVETPLFMRPTVPYAAYMPAGAFEAQQEGLYYVTPVNQQLPPEERAEQMLGHNYFGMLLTNVHEGYPGHHLQLVLASQVASPVRKLLSDTVFCEGWALYCEQLVLDQGLRSDPRVRLFQLKDQLWRACRVVIDVKLHTDAMTFDEAVDMLVSVAHLERPNAIGEVRRYTQEPTQPMSYLMGKQQIMALRERERARLGGKFELRIFHDRLLSYGTIPVALIEPTFIASAGSSSGRV